MVSQGTGGTSGALPCSRILLCGPTRSCVAIKAGECQEKPEVVQVFHGPPALRHRWHSWVGSERAPVSQGAVSSVTPQNNCWPPCRMSWGSPSSQTVQVVAATKQRRACSWLDAATLSICLSVLLVRQYESLIQELFLQLVGQGISELASGSSKSLWEGMRVQEWGYVTSAVFSEVFHPCASTAWPSPAQLVRGERIAVKRISWVHLKHRHEVICQYVCSHRVVPDDSLLLLLCF